MLTISILAFAASPTGFDWIFKLWHVHHQPDLTPRSSCPAALSDDQDLLFKDFEAITQGIKELKLHFSRRQSYYQDELTPHAATYRDRWVHAMFFFSLAGGIGLVLFFVPIGFLLFLMPRFLDLSPSLVASLALVIVFMLTPLRGILLGLPQLSSANISLQKVESLGLSLATYVQESSHDPQPKIIGNP